MTGFEPLIAAATAGLASLITETIKSSGGKVLGIFDYDLGQNIKETIFQASGAQSIDLNNPWNCLVG